MNTEKTRPSGAWRDVFSPDAPTVATNLYLDHSLRLKRGPDGTELDPRDCMASGDGYLHFSIPTTVAEEAAWWALGHPHAVPCSVNVSLLRPAHVHKGPLVGRGEIIRIGRQIMWAKGCCTQDMKRICEVTVTFTLFEKRGDAKEITLEKGAML